MKQAGWAIFVACVVLFPATLMPVLGWAGPAASALLALVLAVRLGSGGHGATWWARLTIGAALLGSVVGVASVIAAFGGAAADLAHADAYSARSVFGWLALACSVAAAGAALVSVTRPYLASIILVTSGIVGGIAINLFSINTAYGAAVLLWWLGALAASRRPSGKGPGSTKGSWMD